MYGWEKTLDKLSSLEQLRFRALQICLHYLLPYLLVSKSYETLVGQFPWKIALGVELAFYLWMALVVLPRLHSKRQQIEPCHQSIEDVWTSSMDAAEAAAQLGYPLEKFFSGWFLGADMKSIPHGNFLGWASYMMYGQDASSLDSSRRQTVAATVDKMCTRFDLKPPSGEDPGIRYISLFGEPLRIYQRSLLIHTITVAAPRFAVGVVFRSVLGLQRVCCKETGMYYWWRAPLPTTPDSADSLPDLFFFHGLCGFTGYLPLLMAILLESPSRGAVLFEIEDVSQSLIFSRQMSRDAVVKTARSAQERLQAERQGSKRSCIILGHSLGSCAAAQLLQEPPTAVAGLVLIDPVCILLQLPDVAHGFLHRAPQTLFDWFCFIWCATEPGIAQFFRRRFFWYNSYLDVLTARDVPALVCLSENDRLVPSRAVRAYVDREMPKADVLWWEKLDHTYFMASPSCISQLLQWVRKCSKAEAGGEAVPPQHMEPHVGG